MAIRLPAAAIDDVHTLFNWGTMATSEDGHLVARFLSGQDDSEAAFRALIHRHGPMVMGICRRVLGDEHAAEDAFQATFLVLVKKAGGLRDSDLLANWLYGVALRVSKREKAKSARQRAGELREADQVAVAAGDLDQFELRSLIDEEIQRLPEHYRVPLVLCHLEGMRHDEVAQRLGCPVGTIESRLSRARDQLRGRLTRRGLAPADSEIGAALGSPVLATPLLRTSTIEATVKAAIELTSRRTGVGLAFVWSLMERVAAHGTSLHSAMAASILVVCAGIVVLRFGSYRAGPELPPAAGSVTSRATVAAEFPRPIVQAEKSSQPQRSRLPKARPPINSRAREEKPELPRPVRFPTAFASKLSNIVIDGRLDEWPADLPRYPIRNKLLGSSFYNSEKEGRSGDSDAYFIVGFDRERELIYLAVVVRDQRLIVHRDGGSGSFAPAFETDAVEVYVDGTFSDRSIPVPPDGLQALDASKMPALQYIAVPGRVAAYCDSWGANPSLMYAKTREKHTRMKYRRTGELTTYEWAIQAYDHYPDKPTRLFVGKRLGLDVAVVDKDSVLALPSFFLWGSTDGVYKGCNAESLGELVLIDNP